MATNQRTGIIAKYAKDFGLISLPSFSGVAPVAPPPTGSWFSSSPSTGPLFPSTSSAPLFSGFGLPSLPTVSLAASGGYALEVLFYLFLYGFVAFFILLLIHYTIHPIFQFIPGGSGLIPMSTTNDYMLYWVGGVQPITPAPDPSVTTDLLITYPFDKLYSLSVDVYITDLTGRTGLDRLIFYGSSDTSLNSANLTYSLDKSLSLSENFASGSMSGVNMICYIADETNDLIVTYFVKTATGALLQKSSIPIQNIPLFTTVRITIIYDNSMFSVYYNGLQISQTSMLNTVSRNPGKKQNFYANRLNSKCGYVQTLVLWNRVITYPEILGLNLALTAKAKFNVLAAGESPPGQSCGTVTKSSSSSSTSPSSTSPSPASLGNYTKKASTEAFTSTVNGNDGYALLSFTQGSLSVCMSACNSNPLCGGFMQALDEKGLPSPGFDDDSITPLNVVQKTGHNLINTCMLVNKKSIARQNTNPAYNLYVKT